MITAAVVISRPSRYAHKSSARAKPIAPYVSVLCSIWPEIQYTVIRWSTSMPTAKNTAPGSSATHGMSGSCGMYHDTANHKTQGMARNRRVATRPRRNDSPRSLPMRATIANANVTTSTSTPAARAMLGGFPARVCHTSAWTIRSTFNSARVARSSANVATKNETIRWPVLSSPMLSNALPAKPPMPASRAR